MFFPEGQVRIFVYGEPVNMRLSYDGLYAKIRSVMGKDPMSGHLFAFINRRATQMKVMYWNRSGFCIWSKGHLFRSRASLRMTSAKDNFPCVG